jgi:hypothetical protein
MSLGHEISFTPRRLTGSMPAAAEGPPRSQISWIHARNIRAGCSCRTATLVVFTHISRFALAPPFNADSTELCTVLLPGKYLYAVRDCRPATLAPRGVDTGATGARHGASLQRRWRPGHASAGSPDVGLGQFAVEVDGVVDVDVRGDWARCAPGHRRRGCGTRWITGGDRVLVTVLHAVA